MNPLNEFAESFGGGSGADGSAYSLFLILLGLWLFYRLIIGDADAISNFFYGIWWLVSRYVVMLTITIAPLFVTGYCIEKALIAFGVNELSETLLVIINFTAIGVAYALTIKFGPLILNILNREEDALRAIAEDKTSPDRPHTVKQQSQQNSGMPSSSVIVKIRCPSCEAVQSINRLSRNGPINCQKCGSVTEIINNDWPLLHETHHTEKKLLDNELIKHDVIEIKKRLEMKEQTRSPVIHYYSSTCRGCYTHFKIPIYSDDKWVACPYCGTEAQKLPR